MLGIEPLEGLAFDAVVNERGTSLPRDPQTPTPCHHAMDAGDFTRDVILTVEIVKQPAIQPLVSKRGLYLPNRDPHSQHLCLKLIVR
jgi:hypothetical protein